MKTSRLYPTLSRFYQEKPHDAKNEPCTANPPVPEFNLGPDHHPSDAPPYHRQLHNNRSSFPEESTRPYPQLPNESANYYNLFDAKVKGHNPERHRPVEPTAPPEEMLNETLLRFLQDVVWEQAAHSSPLDETPSVDYSALDVSGEYILSENWVDDLLPDYDVTLENAELGILNNLNKSEVGSPANNVSSWIENSEETVKLNIVADELKTKTLHRHNFSQYSRPCNDSEHHKERQARLNLAQPYKDDHEVQAVGRARRETNPASNDPHRETAVSIGDINNTGADIQGETHSGVRLSPGSPEYKSWMTWRKQVNRQLATVILLRHNGHLPPHKPDLARKHLNQRSIDFVSSVVKSENKTSLGGKPFLMYGIPRASLSGTP